MHVVLAVISHAHVPLLYTWLGRTVAVFTVTMAVLALVRLRPARRREKTHDVKPDVPAGSDSGIGD